MKTSDLFRKSALYLALGLISATPNRAFGQDSRLVVIRGADISSYPETVLYLKLDDSLRLGIGPCGSDAFGISEATGGVSLEVPMFDFKPLNSTFSRTAISIALVIDTSGSVSGTALAAAKQAAQEFVNTIQSQDRAAIIEFNSEVFVRQEYTNDKALLIAAIAQMQAGGSTMMIDATIEALKLTAEEPGNRGVIVFTDGMTAQQDFTKEDMIELAKDILVPIYTIGVGGIDEEFLRDVSESTNGEFRRAEYAELGELYVDLVSGFRSQFRLIYRSPFGGDTRGPRDITLQVKCAGGSPIPAGPTATFRYFPKSEIKITPDENTTASIIGSSRCRAGESYSLSFEIPGGPYDAAKYFYRSINTDAYTEALLAVEGDRFVAEIPAESIEDPGFECYLAITRAGVTGTYPKAIYEPTVIPMQVLTEGIAPPSIEVLSGDQIEGTAFDFIAMVSNPQVANLPGVLPRPSDLDLYYRRPGQIEFQVKRMSLDDGQYRATIDSAFVTTVGIEFAIIATDQRGVRGTYGQLDSPLLLSVDAMPAPEIVPTEGLCGGSAMMASVFALMYFVAGRVRRRNC